MHERCAALREQVDLVLFQPNTVHHKQPGRDQARLVEQPDRSRAEPLHKVGTGVRTLVDVQVAGRVEILGHGEGTRDGVQTRRPQRVRCRLDHDAGFALMLRRQLPQPFLRGLGFLPEAGGRGVFRRVVVESAGQYQPDADVTGRADHLLGVGVALVVQIEEVHRGGDPRQRGLGEGEHRAPVDVLSRQCFRERVHDVVSPAQGIPVVGEALEQALEGVPVGIHRAGDDSDVAPVLDRHGRVHFGPWADVGDVFVLDDHGMVVEEPVGPVDQ